MQLENRYKSKKYEVLIRVLVCGLILATFIYIIVHKSITEPNLLNKNHRFTIGTVTEIVNPPDGETMLDFTYSVLEKYYKGTCSVDGIKDRKYRVGQRFYVKYFPLDPTICYFMLDHLVPDTIGRSPGDGWGVLPTAIDLEK